MIRTLVEIKLSNPVHREGFNVVVLPQTGLNLKPEAVFKMQVQPGNNFSLAYVVSAVEVSIDELPDTIVENYHDTSIKTKDELLTRFRNENPGINTVTVLAYYVNTRFYRGR